MGARDFALQTDADALIGEVWREYLAPPRKLTVTEWAEANRVLSSKDSAEPGPYRVHRTPYAREPQDCLSAHSSVQEVVLIWGAQTSKTTIMLNWVGYTADVNPGPMMVTQPTIDMGKRFSRQRVAPLIEESATLRAKVKENRSRDEANTTLLKEFPGGFLAIAGANSAAGLRSMPVRDLGEDEIDGYPLDVDGEGDPCLLAEARQTTFARFKRLKTSTPTIKYLSRIEASYMASDRCRFHVPCPHCQAMQPLEWGADKAHGIKWDRDAEGAPIADSVRYVCRHCGAEIREHHKPGMLAAGQWVADNPGAGGGRVRGFHLSSLYSPLGWLSWTQIVLEWHRAMTAARQGDTSLLRVFVNTRLAETYEEQGERADAHALAKRAEAYALRTVPWGGLIITGSTDVQGDRLECYAYAWGRGEESWLVDFQAFYGDPSIVEGQPGSLWDRVTEWRRTAFLHAGGAELRMAAHGIDTGGHHTQVVYGYARRHAHANVLAFKGASIRNAPILGKPSDVEINHRGQKLKKGVKLWPVGTDTAKTLLQGRLRLERAGPGFVHFSQALPGDVYEQITAERLVTKYVKGRPQLQWVNPPGKRNEATDCAVYNIAAAAWLGIPRYTDVHWAKLERHVRQGSLFAAAPVPEAPPAEPEQPEVLQPETAGHATLAPEPREQTAATSTQQPPAPAQQAADPPQTWPSTVARKAPARRGWFTRKW